MAIEAIQGAGMTYQGGSSTTESKIGMQSKIDEGRNIVATNELDQENMMVNVKGANDQNSDDGGHLTSQQKEQTKQSRQIRKAVEEINKSATGSQSEAIFGIHDKTNRVTIKIVDKKSREVIKEYPPEKTLDMIAKVWEMAGIMVDEKR